MSDLIVPENVEAIGNNLMSVGGIVGKSDCVLTNAVVNVPEYTGAFDVWMFNIQQNLKTLTLNAPKVTRINQGMFNGCYSLVADASEWRLDGVEIIGSWSVPGDAKVTGELCLPSLTNVTRSAGLCYFDGTAFKFGTKYRPADGAVFSLATATNCFVGCLKVTRLELGAYAGADFYDNAFAGLSGLKEIVFHGRPFERAQLDKLFAGVGDLKVVMRASQLLGWQVGKLAGMRAATQAELDALPADAEASRVTGVYETADGKRAWVVHRASEWDPKGIVLIVR